MILEVRHLLHTVKGQFQRYGLPGRFTQVEKKTRTKNDTILQMSKLPDCDPCIGRRFRRRVCLKIEREGVCGKGDPMDEELEAGECQSNVELCAIIQKGEVKPYVEICYKSNRFRES